MFIEDEKFLFLTYCTSTHTHTSTHIWVRESVVFCHEMATHTHDDQQYHTSLIIRVISESYLACPCWQTPGWAWQGPCWRKLRQLVSLFLYGISISSSSRSGGPKGPKIEIIRTGREKRKSGNVSNRLFAPHNPSLFTYIPLFCILWVGSFYLGVREKDNIYYASFVYQII